MTFSLSALKPQVIDARIQGYGDDIIIPIRPLTYVEWNNAIIGLEIPKPETVRRLVDGKNQDVLDTDNPVYQKAVTEYNTVINFRRLAVALSGAGAKELQGLTIAEQVEILREMDAGITNALIDLLKRMALLKRADRFQKQPVSANGDENMQSPEVDS